MPNYEKPNEEIKDLVDDVLRKYHSAKAQAGLLVDVIMARPKTDENGDPVGHAITHAGYRALATIKICSLKERVAHGADCQMTIDAWHFEQCTTRQREAIVDHELTHVELMIDDHGNVKRDDAERPRLRIRKHDQHFGWFDCVARHFGEDSTEIMQCRTMLAEEEFRQVYLFDVGPAAVPPKAKGKTAAAGGDRP